MTKPKLTYFDAPISRGEECRLALFVAGVDFEDVRLKRDEWLAMKPSSPFGSLPVFELPGQPPLAQSNAILSLIGRRHGLLPKDDVAAAHHESMMCHVEDLRAQLSPTLRMTNDAEKKAAREALAASYLPAWATYAERHIEGPFVGGKDIQVSDLKIFMAVKWLTSGSIDHMPTNVFAKHEKLTGVHDAVLGHERVKAWYARA